MGIFSDSLLQSLDSRKIFSVSAETATAGGQRKEDGGRTGEAPLASKMYGKLFCETSQLLWKLENEVASPFS